MHNPKLPNIQTVLLPTILLIAELGQKDFASTYVLHPS